MDIDALKTELAAGHPDTGAYSVDAVIAASEINAPNRNVNKAEMTGSAVFNIIDATEWAALSRDAVAEVWNILHLGPINPFGLEAVRLSALFGGGSATTAALAAIRKSAVSRAVELGLGTVKPGHVKEARRG